MVKKMSEESFLDNIKINTVEENEKEVLKKIGRYDKELQSKTFQNIRRHDELIVHIRTNLYGNRKVVQAQFRTLGCRMKKLGSCWNCNYGVADECLITPNQYIKAFKREIKKQQGDVLVLESLGSITDPKEFNRNILKTILELAIEHSKFKTILIETHLTQIDEELVSYINAVNKSKKYIGFEIGIEDMNPENRKLINKIGVQNDKLKDIYNMLNKYGIGLDINLIYGFPFMSEQERIQSVVQSVKNISINFSKADIVLFLMSIKENTIMEYMYKKGIYKLANPWGLVETTSKILEDEDIENLITFSWFGEKEDPYITEETCYTCPECKDLIINFFKNINGTFDRNQRKKILDILFEDTTHLKCDCYQNFRQQLKKDDGKNPKIRYREFIKSIHKEVPLSL